MYFICPSILYSNNVTRWHQTWYQVINKHRIVCNLFYFIFSWCVVQKNGYVQIQYVVFGHVWGKKKRRGHEEIICSVVAGKYLTTRFPLKVSGNGIPVLEFAGLFPWYKYPIIIDFKLPMWPHGRQRWKEICSSTPLPRISRTLIQQVEIISRA